MDTVDRPKGSRGQRVAVRFFALCLAVTIFWLLGFVISDIGAIRGPDLAGIQGRFVDASLAAEQQTVEQGLEAVRQEIQDQTKRRDLRSSGTTDLQKTLDQLLEIQRLSLERDIRIEESQARAFADSLQLFLETQREIGRLNERLSQLNEELLGLEKRARELRAEITRQQVPARQEYDRLRQRNELRKAILKLAVLIPLLAVGTLLFLKARRSSWMPLVLAFTGAVAVQVILVMHTHFPKRLFRYVLVIAAILALVRILVAFLRAMRAPRAAALARQYHEAYERFLCPVCEYPIRRGPLRFAFWTRRTARKLVPAAEAEGAEEPYTCPACGTRLFETCGSCGGVRHSLLPACMHCGAITEPHPLEG
ncbi:MAG: hypothetical protein JXR77_00655 [Lentisphaeria bacterium]|nr:hypothetical protein [Lentisphaeria bacterium]